VQGGDSRGDGRKEKTLLSSIRRERSRDDRKVPFGERMQRSISGNDIMLMDAAETNGSILFPRSSDAAPYYSPF